PIQLVDGRVGLLQGKAGTERLEAKMILLVDHQPEAVGKEDRRSTPQRMLRVEPRQLFAHQMTLMEQRARRRRQILEPVHHGVTEGRNGRYRVAHLRQYAEPLAVARPAGERKTFDVPGQPDTRGQDDVGMSARGVEPTDAAVWQK